MSKIYKEKEELPLKTLDGGIVREILIKAIPILIAVTFHEVAHGYAAYKLGDKTAWALGRLSLNPIKHVDPVGTVLVPALLLVTGSPVFGWAKPVPINPYNFKNPRKGMAITGGAGPATNILLAIVCVIIYRHIIPLLAIVSPDFIISTILRPLSEMFRYGIIINAFLACFNLLPFPPLDGGRVAVGLLPPGPANTLSRVEPYGFIILIILIFTGLYKIFVIPLFELIMAFLNLF